MKVSLWLVYDALKELAPEITIINPDKQNIESIRLYFPDLKRNDNTLYVEKEDLFLHNGSDRVMCINGENYIIFNSCQLNLVFNKIFIFLEKTMAWVNQVSNMISNNCLLRDILNQFNNMIPFPLMVLDSSQVALAVSEKFGIGTVDVKWDNMLLTGSFGIDILTDYNLKHQEKISTNEFYSVPADPFPFASYNHNIYINNEFMGFFSMILRNGELTEIHKAWFNIAYRFVINWMTLYSGKNDILIRDAFFKEMLSGYKKNTERFEAALITQGWKKDTDKKIAVLSCVSSILNMHSHVIKIINQMSPYLYAAEYQNMIVILINSSMLTDVKVISLIQPLLKSIGYYGGLSNSFSDLSDIRHFLRQAMLPVNEGPPAVGEIESCNNYIMPYIMELLRENSRMNLLHPALPQLKNYDQHHKTDYYDLLRVYLEMQGNQSRTAQFMNISRSSLIRKLHQLNAITDINLDDPLLRLHLLFSYEMEK